METQNTYSSFRMKSSCYFEEKMTIKSDYIVKKLS